LRGNGGGRCLDVEDGRLHDGDKGASSVVSLLDDEGGEGGAHSFSTILGLALVALVFIHLGT